MLMLRVLSAAILIPIVVLGIFTLDGLHFALITSFIILLAAWEWSRLMGLQNKYYRAFYSILLYFLLFLIPFEYFDWILCVCLAWWGIIIYWEIIYPHGVQQWAKPWLTGLLGTQLLLPFWLALVSFLYPNSEKLTGRYLLMYLLVLIWAADIGAYFCGRQWGKHKLASEISPKKTIEGVIGGSFFAILVAIAAAFLFKLSYWNCVKWLVLSLLTVLISVVGDLAVSMLKRLQNLKDSGCLIPGHGGLLDRIDSLIAAVPFFAFGYYLLQLRISI